MIKTEWKSYDNAHSYRLEITDGREDTLTVDASATPFTLDGDSSEDFFKAVRTQSGNIGLSIPLGVIDRLMGSNPLARPVKLYRDNFNIWNGFLEQATYTQAWDWGDNDVTIPVVSALGICERVELSLENLYYQSFAAFLYELNELLGEPWAYFSFPARNNTTETLLYKFSRQNYIKWNSQEQKYDCENYLKVLEDICNLFGWQVQEDNIELVFSAHDVENTYDAIGIQELYTLAQGEEAQWTQVTSQVKTQQVCDALIDGTGHNIDYIPGKKSIKVTGNVNKFPNLFEMDIKNHQRNISQSASKVWKDNKTYRYASASYLPNEELSFYNNTNVKLETFSSDPNVTGVKASCLVKEAETNEDDLDSGSERLILSKDNFDFGVVTVKPKMPFQDTVLTRQMAFAICFKGQFAEKAGDFFEDSNNDFKFSIQCGRLYYSQSLPSTGQTGDNYGWSQYQDTNYVNVTGGDGHLYPGNTSFVYQIRNANINIETPYAEDGDCNGNIIIKFWIYYKKWASVQDFKIQWNYQWALSDSGLPEERNEKKYDISNGFKEEISLECDLTTRQHTIQYGTGLILSADLLSAPANLGITKTPEEDLAYRMQTYYSKSRKMIKAVMKTDGGMLGTHNLYCLDGVNNFAIISQSVDYLMNQSTVTFIEV